MSGHNYAPVVYNAHWLALEGARRDVRSNIASVLSRGTVHTMSTYVRFSTRRPASRAPIA